jgi:hypothetical protein
MNKKQYLKLLKSQGDVWSRFIVWLSQKKRKKRKKLNQIGGKKMTEINARPVEYDVNSKTFFVVLEDETREEIDLKGD